MTSAVIVGDVIIALIVGFCVMSAWLSARRRGPEVRARRWACPLCRCAYDSDYELVRHGIAQHPDRFVEEP